MLQHITEQAIKKEEKFPFQDTTAVLGVQTNLEPEVEQPKWVIVRYPSYSSDTYTVLAASLSS